MLPKNVKTHPRRWHALRDTTALILVLVSARIAIAQSQVTEEDLRESQRSRRQIEAENAESRRQVEQLKASVKGALATVVELEAGATSLYEQLDALMTDDDGKRIGADEDSLKAFIVVHNRPRVATHTIDTRKQFLSSLNRTLETELGRVNVGFIPSPQQMGAVEEHKAWAQQRLESVNEQRAWLKSTLAGTTVDAQPPAGPTLQERIDAHTTKLFLERIAEYNAGAEEAYQASLGEFRESGRLAKAERATAEAEELLANERLKNRLAEQEASQKQAAAQAEIDRLKNDLEIEVQKRTVAEKERLAAAEMEYKNKLAELERRIQQDEAERYAADTQSKLDTDKTIEDAERLKKKALAQSDEVQRLLQPFTTPGFMRANQKGENYNKKPHSLSGLRSIGALDQTIQGATKLYNIATTKKDKVRPRWGKAKRWKNLNQATKEKAKRAQRYLIDLGEVMVELGMLAK